VGEKSYDPNKYDLFEIPRIQLGNEPWWKTKLRINSTFESIKSILRPS
jgi:hypothetical protein